MKVSRILPVIILLGLALGFSTIPVHATYVPSRNDYFNYSETIDLNNGQGNYQGYTEHQTVQGGEQMTTVTTTNSTVASHYAYTYTWSNSSGSSKSGSLSGNFTWSYATFHYVKGTDNQTGYVNPTVWFFMDNAIPQGGTFSVLNTQMTVLNRNESYQLTSQNRYVQSIHARGSSSYQRNDVYGNFNAAYTWDTYFDPTTGFVVGYNYVEHDTDNSGNGFTWTDNLYVTTTSYSLATASAPSSSSNTNLSDFIALIVGLFVIFLIIIIIVAIIVVLRRRRGLPQHTIDYSRVPSPYTPPAPQTIQLEPKQGPEQVVIREVAKVRCKYCGALVDSTATVCPICGGPTT